MSESFVIKKTIESDVLFILRPLSNQSITKIVHLTNRIPQMALPEDWALGVFFDPSVYAMYQKGYFTFDRNDALVKAAQAAGVYFNDELDFTPADTTAIDDVLKILKKGNRSEIMKAIDKYGKDVVRDSAIAHADDLTQGVVSMLEGIFNIQLTLNND